MKSLWAGRSVSIRVGDPLKAPPPPPAKQRPPPCPPPRLFSHSKRKPTLPCGVFLRSTCVAISPLLSLWCWRRHGMEPPCPLLRPTFLTFYPLCMTSKKHLYLQGWEVVHNEELERYWKDKYEEFVNRTKCKYGRLTLDTVSKIAGMAHGVARS